jgi:hypothetical protein
MFLTYGCRFSKRVLYLPALNEVCKMTFGRVPMFAAIMAAVLFIAATLHHSRESLKVPEAIKSWAFQKSVIFRTAIGHNFTVL